MLLERFRPGPGRIVPRHQVGDGGVLLEVTAEQGLEGIVAKRLGSLYVPGKRSPSWRKVKHRPQQELVVGGFTAGGGNRTGRFGALLVGVYEGNRLRFGGGVGSGFDQKMLESLTGPAAGAGHARLPLRPPAAEELRPRCHVGAARDRRGGRLRRVDERGVRPPGQLPRPAGRQAADRGGPRGLRAPAQEPVWPKPPPRPSPESWSTSTSSASSTRWRTSCAMRSPRRTRYSWSGSVFSRMTFTSSR